MVLQRHSAVSGRYTTAAKSKVPRGDTFQKAFQAEWEQENDDPSGIHAEESKDSHKLDTFSRHDQMSVKMALATATDHSAV